MLLRKLLLPLFVENQINVTMKRTIIDLFEESVAKYGSKEFLLEKHNGKFEPTTYNETKRRALNIGAGLAALGVERGDRISILAEGCNNWIISELGLLYAGAISVPLSNHQLNKIRNIVAELPDLKHVIVWGNVNGGLRDGEISLEDIETRGQEWLNDNREAFMAIGKSLQNISTATGFRASRNKGFCIRNQSVFICAAVSASKLVDIAAVQVFHLQFRMIFLYDFSKNFHSGIFRNTVSGH